MNMDLLKIILTASAIVVSLLTSLLALIARNSKNSKIAKKATSLLSVIKAVEGFIEEAEVIVNFNGSNKKEWVLTKVNQFCIEHNISYDAKEVESILEDLIDFSKGVNAKETNEEVL